jgi:hypothetical protein
LTTALDHLNCAAMTVAKEQCPVLPHHCRKDRASVTLVTSYQLHPLVDPHDGQTKHDPARCIALPHE